MKFPVFREFKSLRYSSIDLSLVIKYLSSDLSFSLKELFTGLRRLTFLDNFESFQETVTIGAGLEVAVRNELSVIPSGKLILKSNNNAIIDGITENDKEFVYLRNPSGTSATVTVLWLR